MLINDILDLTKIEAGKLELVTVDFDLRTALEDAVDSVAGRAMAKGLEICCYLDPGAQTRIMGDPDRLRQIFLNLFSNGIKFTAAGQVYVVVEVEEMTATHQTFRFKVSSAFARTCGQGFDSYDSDRCTTRASAYRRMAKRSSSTASRKCALCFRSQLFFKSQESSKH